MRQPANSVLSTDLVLKWTCKNNLQEKPKKLFIRFFLQVLKQNSGASLFSDCKYCNNIQLNTIEFNQTINQNFDPIQPNVS